MNSPFVPPPTIPLCDSRGRLNPDAVGWSSQPRVDCSLPGNLGRRKRWNHWSINTPDWTLSLTQADLDYVGYGAAYFLDLNSGHNVAHSQLSLFGRGCSLPDTPLGSHAFDHPRLQLHFNEYPGRVRLTATSANIGGLPLNLALDIQRPAHLESVNLVVPFGKKGFHATCRQVGLPVSGSIQLGNSEYHCTSAQSFASMDFGRGVWPLNSHWTRAAFAAPGGIAGNFGDGWTDHSGLSENALWFGGILLHLDQVVHMRQPLAKPLAPWQLYTDDGQIDLIFTPRQIHIAKPRLGLLYADTQQWFGQYDGLLRDAQGERVPVKAALGWMGATQTRW
ncbi:DUF2804 domain-containing protein [Pseudomonas daroniae]|uniref:DUF2804 domain-containing protein n=1 Tax=Phytopseudomonas daroniae TaxID=2487519 RepID=A0A4Q9QLV2_9GAMM|nr:MULTISPECIES: DUF2804 domain-containing protein [Pseudomonas]TBU77427.1 DUF2804 domain-containing protein [Pseudomonas daroniae]TBU79418.1 DUF2804 domain-containing protein [Pseudomonas daroniae]TBU79502.1 DUF2804 domain-containing protein [Pseudomonas sp. FRB 228]TBU91518.1 DUF2804 domain-containing protein [Pseudomonas daroniae]